MNVLCRHLRKAVGSTDAGGVRMTEFACASPNRQTTTLSRCLTCAEFVPHHRAGQALQRSTGESGASQRPLRRHPVGVVVDRFGRDAGVADLYLGASVFLLLGGPSVTHQPLDMLARRGILIASVNNCPAALPPPLRPHIWMHTDPTGKFHNQLWHDPAILKFSPVRQWQETDPEKRQGIRRRRADGALEQIPNLVARQMPAVFGFHRNHTFDPDRWLFEPTINQGNDKKSAANNEWPHVVNTFPAVLRLLFYLGVATVYLLGADFRMDFHRPYATAQRKNPKGVRGNNETYAKLCVLCQALRPQFDGVGYHVVNATPESRLWAFDRIEFEAAVEQAAGRFDSTLDTSGWYD